MILDADPIEASRAALSAAYRDPGEAMRDAVSRGLPVIARIGVGIPDEIILACGGFATALVPQLGTPTPIADAYMDPEEQPELRSLLDQIASSDRRLIRLAVLTTPYSMLAATIEDLRRTGLLPGAIPTEYLEFLVERSDANRRYGERRLRDLLDRIAVATGIIASEATLRRAIVLTNRRRKAVSDFQARRRATAAISGADAFRALGASQFLAPDRYCDLLEALTATLSQDAARERRPRILLIPSSPLTHDHAHEAIEAAGGRVIAEDDPLGARGAEEPIADIGDPIAALADHYLRHATGARAYPAEARQEWFKLEAARQDVDGVIFYAQEARYGWDHPAMRGFLDAQGRPSRFIRADARTADGRARMEAEVRTFIAELVASTAEAAR